SNSGLLPAHRSDRVTCEHSRGHRGGTAALQNLGAGGSIDRSRSGRLDGAEETRRLFLSGAARDLRRFSGSSALSAASPSWLRRDGRRKTQVRPLPCVALPPRPAATAPPRARAVAHREPLSRRPPAPPHRRFPQSCTRNGRSIRACPPR